MGKKSLFLDRDGVINRQIIGGYVTDVNEFIFLDGVLACFKNLSEKFDYIFIVTNQQGIGKGIFTENDLHNIHQYMLGEISKAGGRIDKIYGCPDLESAGSINRKPSIGMALQAKKDFPDIDFSNSIMAGDSLSDMLFGKKSGMKTVFLTNHKAVNANVEKLADEIYSRLEEFSRHLT